MFETSGGHRARELRRDVVLNCHAGSWRPSTEWCAAIARPDSLTMSGADLIGVAIS